MMRSKVLGWTVAAALAVALPALAAEKKVFGSGVKATETISLAKLVADPAAYDGKVVRVEGKVLDVCPKRGCWMELGGSDGTVRIQVEDDVIVFPAAAKSKTAVAEGKVEVSELDRDRYVRWMAHLAEERGEAFDATKIGAGPFRLVQIQATGAEISGL